MFENFIQKLHNKPFLTLETTPGHSAVCDEIIDSIQSLGLEHLVDGFTTTDSPLSKLKFSSLFAATILQQKLQKPIIATLSMRDRNSIALQSDLLGANCFDVRAILALTGDSVKISNQPNPKGVFESDSSLLLQIIQNFNSGVDLAKKAFKNAPKHIYPFAVTPSDVNKKESLQKKMIKKLNCGVEAIITQPLFDTNDVEPLIEIFEGAKAKSQNKKATLVIGCFPIVKLKTANFLNSKVPGANIPQRWLEKLQNSNDEYSVGFELSREIYTKIMQTHGKCHLMVANNFKLAQTLITS